MGPGQPGVEGLGDLPAFSTRWTHERAEADGHEASSVKFQNNPPLIRLRPVAAFRGLRVPQSPSDSISRVDWFCLSVGYPGKPRPHERVSPAGRTR